MGVLLLVRHGQGSLGTSNYDELSELGLRQSRLVGARLARADLRVTQTWCGALARQRETARTVLAELGLPPGELHADDRLDEYDHLAVLAADRAADPQAADRAGAPWPRIARDALASDRAGAALAADRAGDPLASVTAPAPPWPRTAPATPWPRITPATPWPQTAPATRSPWPSRLSPAWPCSRRWTRRSAGGSRAAPATRSRTTPSPPGSKPWSPS